MCDSSNIPSFAKNQTHHNYHIRNIENLHLQTIFVVDTGTYKWRLTYAKRCDKYRSLTTTTKCFQTKMRDSLQFLELPLF